MYRLIGWIAGVLFATVVPYYKKVKADPTVTWEWAYIIPAAVSAVVGGLAAASQTLKDTGDPIYDLATGFVAGVGVQKVAHVVANPKAIAEARK